MIMMSKKFDESKIKEWFTSSKRGDIYRGNLSVPFDLLLHLQSMAHI